MCMAQLPLFYLVLDENLLHEKKPLALAICKQCICGSITVGFEQRSIKPQVKELHVNGAKVNEDISRPLNVVLLAR